MQWWGKRAGRHARSRLPVVVYSLHAPHRPRWSRRAAARCALAGRPAAPPQLSAQPPPHRYVLEADGVADLLAQIHPHLLRHALGDAHCRDAPRLRAADDAQRRVAVLAGAAGGELVLREACADAFDAALILIYRMTPGCPARLDPKKPGNYRQSPPPPPHTHTSCRYCVICVVLPLPVSPTTMTTGFSRMTWACGGGGEGRRRGWFAMPLVCGGRGGCWGRLWDRARRHSKGLAGRWRRAHRNARSAGVSPLSVPTAAAAGAPAAAPRALGTPAGCGAAARSSCCG